MGPWFMIRLSLPLTLEDPACALLQDLGCAGWESVDTKGGEVELRAYRAGSFPAGLLVDLSRRLGIMADRSGVPRPPSPVVEPVPPQDWEAGWRAHFTIERPLPDLIIRPSWIDYEPETGETVIVIDPKMAFGVGSHPTTRICLGLLREAPRCARVLDVGTGTGILAIAAAHWGSDEIVAVECDPAAAANARENLTLNGVANRVRLVEGSIEKVEGRFDLIMANLLSSELRTVLPGLSGRLLAAGLLIISGYLESEESGLVRELDAYGFVSGKNVRSGEWRGMVAAKRDR